MTDKVKDGVRLENWRQTLGVELTWLEVSGVRGGAGNQRGPLLFGLKNREDGGALYYGGETVLGGGERGGLRLVSDLT